MYGPNCDLNDIDVSLIKDMSGLFCNSIFTGNISKWDVSNVENMGYMFEKSKFNGDIHNWDTSKVRNMAEMFAFSSFREINVPGHTCVHRPQAIHLSLLIRMLIFTLLYNIPPDQFDPTIPHPGIEITVICLIRFRIILILIKCMPSRLFSST